MSLGRSSNFRYPATPPDVVTTKAQLAEECADPREMLASEAATPEGGSLFLFGTRSSSNFPDASRCRIEKSTAVSIKLFGHSAPRRESLLDLVHQRVGEPGLSQFGEIFKHNGLP